MQAHRDRDPVTPPPAAWLGASEADRRFVHAVARRIVRDDDAAHDVAQEAMLLAFRYRDQFRGESSHRTWLYRIATTAALSYLRRERARKRKLAAVLEEVTAGGREPTAVDAMTPADALEEARAAERVADLLATLDDKYRRVFELRFRDGYSERETADALGLSTATVKIRTFRARRMLRERLGVPADVTA